jgi:pilus assembly protein CpaB
MAQSITNTAASGRVNRRFLLLALILAALAAVLVYAAISRSGDPAASSGSVPVVVATSTIPPGARITEDMVEVQNFSAANEPFQALASTQLVVGQVARYPISQGEPVLASKLVDTTITTNDALTYIVEAGKRGMAVQFDEIIGVSGLVLPGDHVDVLWIPFVGAPAFVLLADIEVSAVSQTIVDIAPAAPGLSSDEAQPTVAAGDRIRNSDAAPQTDANSATLLLTPEQTVNVLCAEWFAEKHDGQIRLALRSFGDTAPLQTNAPVCPPVDLFRQFNPEG